MSLRKIPTTKLFYNRSKNVTFCNKTLIYDSLKDLVTRWLTGYKCNCPARSLGFDSRVGRSITGPFSVFENFSIVALWKCAWYMALGSPITWDLQHKLLKVGVHCTVALRVVMCTSAYLLGIKGVMI
ncbi:hypothetical protein SFRURICE_003451 [Spodoptera frugiperda]|nr:hypothetical protein SFRURICE_003451 [Spodoptera frugiperda]